MDLVEVLARQLWRYIGRTLPVEELESFAREGLLSAARSFDPTRHVPFRCWATLRIRGSMLDGLRRLGAMPRSRWRRLRAFEDADDVQLALLEESAGKPPPTTREAADAQLSTYLATMATAIAVGLSVRPRGEEDDDPTTTPEENVADAELVTCVRGAISRLPDPERTLVESHYFGENTIDEAARSLGLSKSWGSRLHARAMEAIVRDLRRARITND